jgi:membrane protein required for beta-lactamase induction
MKKAEAVLLAALPLGATWYLWHSYLSIAVALMTAAFAVILGAYVRGRRDARLKQEKLRDAAKSDGRYIAEHIDDLMQPQVASPGVVPAETRELLASLLSEITQGIRKR